MIGFAVGSFSSCLIIYLLFRCACRLFAQRQLLLLSLSLLSSISARAHAQNPHARTHARAHARRALLAHIVVYLITKFDYPSLNNEYTIGKNLSSALSIHNLFSSLSLRTATGGHRSDGG